MEYFHGSSSASFEGVFDPISPGLKPTGHLLKEGRAPFCGELAMGIVDCKIARGVNLDAISVIPGFRFMEAVKYALAESKKPWNPEIGMSKILKLNSKLESIATDTKYTPEWKEFWLSHDNANLLIENTRLARWDFLSESTKEVISKPYPVIYKITNAAKTIEVRSGISSDAAIHAPKIVDTTVFVPSGKLSFTQELAKDLVEKPQIRTLEQLNDIEEIREDRYRAINHLLSEAVKF